MSEHCFQSIKVEPLIKLEVLVFSAFRKREFAQHQEEVSDHFVRELLLLNEGFNAPKPVDQVLRLDEEVAQGEFSVEDAEDVAWFEKQPQIKPQVAQVQEFVQLLLFREAKFLVDPALEEAKQLLKEPVRVTHRTEYRHLLGGVERPQLVQLKVQVQPREFLRTSVRCPFACGELLEAGFHYFEEPLSMLRRRPEPLPEIIDEDSELPSPRKEVHQVVDKEPELFQTLHLQALEDNGVLVEIGRQVGLELTLVGQIDGEQKTHAFVLREEEDLCLQAHVARLQILPETPLDEKEVLRRELHALSEQHELSRELSCELGLAMV